EDIKIIINETKKRDGFDPKNSALVIEGDSLFYALDDKNSKEFIEFSCLFNTVICCRVTPAQKKSVVDLVKKYKKAVTLAIGDGSNDVSMIKTAHIGVGISGQEGQQAVLASDFSIGQFRFLERLLLVHGRWSYYRISKFLRYYFYKNIAFTLTGLWFSFFSGFSAQIVYDHLFVTLYNTIFSIFPIVLIGIFDQDVSDETSIKNPKLYIQGQKCQLFNTKRLSIRVLHGLISSLVLILLPYATFIHGIDSNGKDISDLNFFGFTVTTILVIVVNLQVGLETSYWTIYNHLSLWGTFLLYFGFHYLYYNTILFKIFDSSLVGVADLAFKTPSFWLSIILSTTILVLPSIAIEFFRSSKLPILKEKIEKIELPKNYLLMKKLWNKRVSLVSKTSFRSVKSGYAFCHTEGFGKLIQNGIMVSRFDLLTTDRSLNNTI
ncbi:unnamed protein product, partial [Brachionus calyciflorus]